MSETIGENKILKPWEREIVEKTRELLGDRTLLDNVQEAEKELIPAHEALLRELNGFDSELFIVTAMGMLKAGKSSFVNLLTRSKKASPTGYGTDTTLRPALIVPATERQPDGEIEVWTELSPPDKKDDEENVKRRKDILASIFDYVRKIGDEPKGAKRDTYPNTEKNLRTILCNEVGTCNELPTDPVIVVVRVPLDKAGESLLSEKVVFLDTPGLDSMRSEWTKKGWYRWLMSESDLLVFLQSSVAPLNKSAGDVLCEVKNSKRGIPIWMIQNRMEAKHWQKDEVQKAENDNQQKRAINEFEALGITAEYRVVNLGKAMSALFPEEDKLVREGEDIGKLKDDSQFEKLERDMRATLDQTAAKHRKGNCIRKVNIAFDNFRKELDDFKKQKVDEILEGYNRKKKEIEKEYEELSDHIEPNKTPSSMRTVEINANEISLQRVRGFVFNENDFNEDLCHAFPDNGKYDSKSLNEFKEDQLSKAKNSISAGRKNLETSKIDWMEFSENEKRATKNLYEKISVRFSGFIDLILHKNNQGYLHPENIDREEVMKRIEICEGPENVSCPLTYEAKKKEFPDQLKFWAEKKRTAKEARDYIGAATYKDKKLFDIIKEYYENEAEKTRKLVAAWANDEFKRLCRSFIDELGKRKKEALDEMESEKKKAEFLSRKVDQIILKLDAAKKEFEKIQN